MESDAQTDWTLSPEDDLAAGHVPECPSLWTVFAPLPEFLHAEAPLAEQEASVYGCKIDNMPAISETKDMDMQTENWTEEKSSNTDEDWEAVMHTIDEYSTRLTQEYNALVREDEVAETEHTHNIESLKKSRDEKQRNYQVLMNKIESLQVKLDLNSSKTTRKNFTVKIEELTADKERLTEGTKRLAQELEEVDRKLKHHFEEQNNEKLSWKQEIAVLQTENGRLYKQVEEANQIALKDEIVALESQRELAISRIEDWIAEAERYLCTLRLDPSQQFTHQRHEWEKNVQLVQNSLSRLQNMYKENLKLLQNGQQLDSLPAISLPHLPNVPSIELFMTGLRNSVQMPHYRAPLIHVPPTSTLPEFHPGSVPVHRLTPPPPIVSSQSFPTSTMTASSYATGPKPRLIMPTAFPPQPPFHMPNMSLPLSHPSPHTRPTYGLPHTVAPTSTYGATGPAHVSMATTSAAAPMLSTTGLPPHAAASAVPQGTLPVSSVQNPSTQNVLSNPPPAGKLDKVLERLGTQFPHCTRTQLMVVLQQIKSQRGTMAGLSMDEIIKQVSQKLAQNDRSAPGPIAPPSGSRGFAAPLGPIQRPSVQPHPMRSALRAPIYQPRPSQAPPIRKLCLMCQNNVEPGTQYNTNCPHTLHKECISTWLQSSKDHSCPFCPSK